MKIVKETVKIKYLGRNSTLIKGVEYKNDAQIVKDLPELFDSIVDVEDIENVLLIEEPVEALKVEIKEEPKPKRRKRKTKV